MLSERLKELRKKEGKTQGEFAAKLGIARSTYSGYERGTSEPDNETLDKIANHFDVTTDYLLGRETTNAKKHPAEDLREYLEQGFSDDEIKKRMDFFVEFIQLNDEQVDEFLSFVRWQLSKKEPTTAASSSKSQKL